MRINNEQTSNARSRRTRHRFSQLFALPLALSALFGAVLESIWLPRALASTPTASLSLVQQSNWVGAKQGFSISLQVNAPIASSDLVLRVRLYPRLISRYALEHTPLEATPTETLNNIALRPSPHPGPTIGQTSTVQFRVITTQGASGGPLSARALHIDCFAGTCDGNYPLTISLINRTTRQRLASLTTTLTYLGTAGTTNRLDVAVALPIDTPPSSLAGGTLTVAQINAITNVAREILGSRSATLSVVAYGRLLARLQATASSANQPNATAASQALSALASLATRTQRIQFVRAPFTPIDLNALISGAGTEVARREFQAQLDSGNTTTAETLHIALPPTPYVSPVPLSPLADALVNATGVCDFVLPTTNVALNFGAQGINAPFNLANTAGSCPSTLSIGGAIDAGFNADIANEAKTPQLAAHQLLADLAQTYFENPNAIATRGVIVAPSQWVANSTFITTLLSGLSASPILKPVTLNSYFHDIPIGSGGGPTSGALQQVSTPNPVVASQLTHAYTSLSTINVVTPNNQSLVENLIAQIYNAESVGLSNSQRKRLLQAPTHAVNTIASSLHLIGTSRVTFTASSGKIPITIHYTGPVLPVKVDLKIRSSSIDFPPSEARKPLTLSLRDTNEVLKVSTRTSGIYTFSIELLVPNQQTVLLGPTTFTITSTAASGVAIALSVGALLVLGLWWSRSILRHRRTKILERKDQLNAPGANPS